MAATAVYNFEINQGASFVKTLSWKDSLGAPIDLTGYTARMQIRKTLLSSTFIVDLRTDNGGIVLGGALGTIDIVLSATQTAGIDETSGVYDLELVSSGGFTTRLLAGTVTISKEVTR